jgi:uncharacterized membrane protein YfcA
VDGVAAFLLADTGLEAWSFALLCGVSFLGSFITATLGLGGGMLMLASMALFMAPAILIPVHGAVQLGSNVGRTALMYKNVIKGIIPVFLAGTILGAAIGAKMVIALPVPLLKATLAIFILYSIWAPKFQASRPGQKTFFGVAVISSFATMFVGATGPLIAPFLSAASTDRKQVVATHGALMTMQHLLKLLAFGLLGFSFAPYLPLLAGLILCGFAGTWIGKHTLNRLPEHIFRIGLKTILTLIALRLLYGAVGAALTPS